MMSGLDAEDGGGVGAVDRQRAPQADSQRSPGAPPQPP